MCGLDPKYKLRWMLTREDGVKFMVCGIRKENSEWTYHGPRIDGVKEKVKASEEQIKEFESQWVQKRNSVM